MAGEGIGRFGPLEQVIAHAILKEQEAVDYYTDLAGRVKNSTLAEELRKIAAMEVQHRERLERLDLGVALAGPAARTPDLKIADYLVETQPSPSMTWQELLTVAMQRELAAMNMYAGLAEQVADPSAARLFATLSAEEAGHKAYFEKIWDEEILLEN